MSDARIVQLDLPALRVLLYPDPRLMQMSTPIAPADIDDSLRALVARMFELMSQTRGVGLAAPQVGLNVRLFIASPTGEPADCRVYINPRIIEVDGWQEEEEGCLSFPGITTVVKRRLTATVEALDADGKIFHETGEGLLARIYQHETDHLDGRLLVDRMGSVAKLANRRALKQMEEDFVNA